MKEVIDRSRSLLSLLGKEIFILNPRNVSKTTLTLYIVLTAISVDRIFGILTNREQHHVDTKKRIKESKKTI